MRGELAGFTVGVHLNAETVITTSSQATCEVLKIGPDMRGVIVYMHTLAEAEALHAAASVILSRIRDREERAHVVERQAARIAELEAQLGGGS